MCIILCVPPHVWIPVTTPNPDTELFQHTTICLCYTLRVTATSFTSPSLTPGNHYAVVHFYSFAENTIRMEPFSIQCVIL